MNKLQTIKQPNALEARIARVIFKSKTEWYWKGRPESYSDHTAEAGIKSLRYHLY